MELVSAAVNAVGAGLQDDVGHGAAGAPQLRFIVAGADIHVLQRLDRRDQDRQQAGAMVVVDALELHVVAQAADAVHLRGQRALRVEELRVRRERARGAGHQVQQRLEVAVVARRQVGQLRRLDFAADIGAVGLEQGDLGGDVDGLGDLAGLEDGVGADGGVDQQLDTHLNLLAKARLFDRRDKFRARVANKKLPLALVSIFRLMPVFISVMVTLAWGTTPPEESVTVPNMLAVTACP